MTALSVVVPAHNEEAVIDRCIGALLDGFPPDGEIVVVCNGCTDATATAAARYGPPVRVIETDVASKAAALNLGDRASARFPRAFVDADVEVTGSDLARTAAAVDGEGGALAAAPALRIDPAGLSWATRAFYRVWLELPWVTDDLIGSGVYVLSERGRARFSEFPLIIADDLFVHRLFRGGERRTVSGAVFTVRPPRRIPDLIHVQIRRRAGNSQYRRVTGASAPPPNGSRPALLGMSRHPSRWPDLAVYSAVGAAARLLGWWKVHFGDLSVWERETGSRA